MGKVLHLVVRSFRCSISCKLLDSLNSHWNHDDRPAEYQQCHGISLRLGSWPQGDSFWTGTCSVCELPTEEDEMLRANPLCNVH